MMVSLYMYLNENIEWCHSALGQGAFGEVYEGLLTSCSQDSLCGRVAVKVLFHSSCVT